ncbi:hypothetical protein ACFOD4_04495 [Pseudoroseomonas globiformis]|uniref:Uncharacterized protein n=1 Tax=Teichococcus globiformis TaxID=2307229 RepID=A0ABV7FYD0_9PROT
MTPALSAFDSIRAAVYADGLRLDYLADLRAVAARLHQIGADRREWIAAADPEMRELEDVLYDAALAVLMGAVEAVARL